MTIPFNVHDDVVTVFEQITTSTLDTCALHLLPGISTSITQLCIVLRFPLISSSSLIHACILNYSAFEVIHIIQKGVLHRLHTRDLCSVVYHRVTSMVPQQLDYSCFSNYNQSASLKHAIYSLMCMCTIATAIILFSFRRTSRCDSNCELHQWVCQLDSKFR